MKEMLDEAIVEARQGIRSLLKILVSKRSRFSRLGEKRGDGRCTLILELLRVIS